MRESVGSAGLGGNRDTRGGKEGGGGSQFFLLSFHHSIKLLFDFSIIRFIIIILLLITVLTTYGRIRGVSRYFNFCLRDYCCGVQSFIHLRIIAL